MALVQLETVQCANGHAGLRVCCKLHKRNVGASLDLAHLASRVSQEGVEGWGAAMEGMGWQDKHQ